VAGPAALIVNPAAGGGRGPRAAAAAAAELAALGVACEVTESASLAHARELAVAAAGRGAVPVAVGGDGMAGALAGALAACPGAVLGLVPAGRGNDLARVLGIPAEPRAAARLLAGAAPRPLDLIGVAAPGQPEAVVAGSVYAGLPSVAGEIANATRWLAGPAVYPVAALRVLAGWRPVTFGLVQGGAGPQDAAGQQDGAGQQDAADQQDRAGRQDRADAQDGPGPRARWEFTGYAVVIANIAYFGAGMMVAPPARPDDGLLDIVAMRHGPRLAFLRVLLSVRTGSHVSRPEVSLDRAAAVTLTMDRAMPVAADGETLPWARPLPAGTPLAVRALPAALKVLAPPVAGPQPGAR
jgi:diacylglycerol kinase (ATP)